MRALRLSLGLFLLTGCVAVEPPGVSVEPIAVPGPWVAPPRVQGIAASHFVPVVDPPPVRPAGSCASSNPFTCSCSHPACIPAHPGTNELREYLLARFPDIRNYGTYCCRQNSNRRDYLSVHAIGRAIDLGVPFASGGGADNTVGDEVANFLVEHAEYIGIQRVIWDYTFWNGERGFGSLGGSPHTDHLHIELSSAGAARETPFFRLGPPGTVCTPSCEGTVRVGDDCERVDCSARGEQCLVDPAPRCGVPEPPEALPVAGATLPAIAIVGGPGRLTFVGPERAFDTRESLDGLVWDAERRELTWTPGLHEDVNGVWFNLAAVPTEPSHVTVFPAGAARPTTSNLNTGGEIRANLVASPLGEADAITMYQAQPLELIGDVYATMAEYGDGLELVPPTRVYDSRSLDAPLPAEETMRIDVQAPEGATGVLGTIAAIEPSERAFVSVFPCGVETSSSTVNLRAGEVASNQIVSGLGPDGGLCVRARRPMHVVIDVLGYFSPEGMLEYQALTPVRLVDTRDATLFENRLAARQTIELPLGEAPGMPENAWAAVFDVVTVDADGRGHLNVYACENDAPPLSSAHNFHQAARATLVTADLGESRRACVRSSTRAHVIVDLIGVWRRRDGAPPPRPMPTPEPHEPGADGDAGTGELDAGVEGPTEGSGCAVSTRGTPALPGFLLLVLFAARYRRRADGRRRLPTL